MYKNLCKWLRKLKLKCKCSCMSTKCEIDVENKVDKDLKNL